MHTPRKAVFVRALVFVLATQVAMVHAAESLKELLKGKGIDSHYVVTYKDAHGKVISGTDFAEQALKHVYSANIDKAHHTATLAVMSAEELSKFMADDKKREQARIKPAQPLPLFHFTTLSGLKFDNDSLQGHTTLINFFFSTCVPCIQEIPVLNEFMRRHPKLQVLAVTFDDADTAREFVAGRKFTWPIVAGTQSFVDQLHIVGYPTLALIGADGKVRKIGVSSAISPKMESLTLSDLERWTELP